MDFIISPLADPVSCFASWPSTARRVARNGNGAFYSVETHAGSVTVGCPNDFAILRDDGCGNVSTLWSANLNTNMVAIDSFPTGELFAAWADFINGIMYAAYWADPSTAAAPVIRQMTGAGCAGNGKIALIASEVDRCLYLFGDAGWIFRLGEQASEYGRQHIYASTSDAPNYISPSLDGDGRLYIGLCNAITTASGAPDYDSITFISTPNPTDIGGIGAVFFAGPWGQSAQLVLPIDPGFNGPAAWATTGAQYRNNNNLLISSAVRNGIIHLLIAQAPGQARRFFDSDDLRSLSVEASSLNFNVQPMFQSGLIHRPLHDGAAYPRACSGGVVIRDCGVFLVLHDRDSLIAMKSIDGGRTWHVYARTPVPGLGSDLIHYVSLMPGQDEDADMIGMFTVVHCTPSQWSNSSAPVPPAYAANNPTASCYRFALPVA